VATRAYHHRRHAALVTLQAQLSRWRNFHQRQLSIRRCSVAGSLRHVIMAGLVIWAEATVNAKSVVFCASWRSVMLKGR
jgi:hypothetical protein